MNILKNVKKSLRIFGKALFYFVMDPVWLISGLVPKNKNLWVFGSWFGNKFADNSKYLFLYVKACHPEIRSIWLSRNSNVVDKLRKEGYEAYKTNSLKGFIYTMRSNFVILSNGLSDVNRFSVAKSKIIQLWHGSPLKKIGYDDEIFSSPRNHSVLRSFIALSWHRVFPFTKEKYDMVIATSKLTQSRLSSAFKIAVDKVPITGYPRNDTLLSTKVSVTFLDKMRKAYKFKYLFFYLPTFRGEINSSFDLFANYNFDVKKIEEVLSNLNGFLLIKTHPVNSISNHALLDRVKKAHFIKTVNDPDIEGDIYPLLHDTDILITDYSSIYFDFLLLNRPIIFAPFDFENYIRKDRELYDNYNDVTPGPKAKNWDEVLMYIKEAIKEPEKYKEERERISKMFNQYRDANSSERVYKAIMGKFYSETK